MTIAEIEAKLPYQKVNCTTPLTGLGTATLFLGDDEEDGYLASNLPVEFFICRTQKRANNSAVEL